VEESEYAVPMESTSAGELVKVAGGGPPLDGIVFDTPSKSKVVVAVLDAARGPVFRTVHPKDLTERTEEAPEDRALHLLIRRTPAPPTRTTGGGSAAAGHQSAGHRRSAMHRTTGK
jgi:hypothetical protein